jgi:predicted alpha/beta hydrolase
MAGYRHAALRVVDIDPNARGIGPIGHMGYFHRRAQPLWGEVLAWFDDAM